MALRLKLASTLIEKNMPLYGLTDYRYANYYGGSPINRLCDTTDKFKIVIELGFKLADIGINPDYIISIVLFRVAKVCGSFEDFSGIVNFVENFILRNKDKGFEWINAIFHLVIGDFEKDAVFETPDEFKEYVILMEGLTQKLDENKINKDKTFEAIKSMVKRFSKPLFKFSIKLALRDVVNKKDPAPMLWVFLKLGEKKIAKTYAEFNDCIDSFSRVETSFNERDVGLKDKFDSIVSICINISENSNEFKDLMNFIENSAIKLRNDGIAPIGIFEFLIQSVNNIRNTPEKFKFTFELMERFSRKGVRDKNLEWIILHLIPSMPYRETLLDPSELFPNYLDKQLAETLFLLKGGITLEGARRSVKAVRASDRDIRDKFIRLITLLINTDYTCDFADRYATERELQNCVRRWEYTKDPSLEGLAKIFKSVRPANLFFTEENPPMVQPEKPEILNSGEQ